MTTIEEEQIEDGIVARRVVPLPAAVLARIAWLETRLDAVTDALEAAGVSPAVGGEADAVTELARRANQPLPRAAQETT